MEDSEIYEASWVSHNESGLPLYVCYVMRRAFIPPSIQCPHMNPPTSISLYYFFINNG